MHANVNKAFLQAMINHGSLSVDYAINKILKPICEAYNENTPSDRGEFGRFVEEINNVLAEFQQALTFIQHPLLADEEFIVFGLTAESAVCKRQAHYSDTDRIYFGELLQKIVVEREYGIAWSHVFSSNATSTQKIPEDRMQTLVSMWSAQGYFLKKDDFLYFGPRMLTEFANYLTTNFKDFVQNCPLCQKLVLWDVTCSHCVTRIHRKCIRKYLSRKSDCPSCSETWETPLTSID